jgi:hypothetical protein
LKEVKQWNIIIHTATALFRPFYTLILVTFVLFFMFAVIGDRMFGGQMSTQNHKIFRDSSIPDLYVEMNFNDLGSSIVTLFALMVVNNWFMIVKINVQDKIYARWFFILFYFSSVVVMLNIVVAFVIDMYGSVENLHRNDQLNAKQDGSKL